MATPDCMLAMWICGVDDFAGGDVRHQPLGTTHGECAQLRLLLSSPPGCALELARSFFQLRSQWRLRNLLNHKYVYVYDEYVFLGGTNKEEREWLRQRLTSYAVKNSRGAEAQISVQAPPDWGRLSTDLDFVCRFSWQQKLKDCYT